jgi:hypothetical protein
VKNKKKNEKGPLGGPPNLSIQILQKAPYTIPTVSEVCFVNIILILTSTILIPLFHFCS